MKEILKFADGSNVVQYGCINGFEVSPGCVNDVQNHIVVCYCNHRDMCNVEDTDSKTIKMKKKIECHDGEIADGVLSGNATCRGELCFQSGNVDYPNKVMAGCVPGVVPNFYEKGCFIHQNFEEGNTELWSCQCRTKFCNNPSSLKIPKRTGSTKCVLQSVVYHENTTENDITTNQTCIGEFCLLKITMYGYSKGCITSSNGMKFSSKKYSLNFGQSSDFYLCDEDWCNQDVATVLNAYSHSEPVFFDIGI